MPEFYSNIPGTIASPTTFTGTTTFNKTTGTAADLIADFKFSGTRVASIRGDGFFGAVSAQFTGNVTPSTGAGLEVTYGAVANTSRLLSFSRTGATYQNFQINALTTTILNSNVTVVDINASRIDVSLPLGLKSYTVATLPSAAVAGQMIYVSNAAGGACMAFSNGTNWLRCDTSAIIT